MVHLRIVVPSALAQKVLDLLELDVPRQGSIALEQIDSQLSEAADEAERATRGMPSDAVVWEEVEARTSETAELGGNFLAFMVLACLIGSVGIFTGSPILIVGAMVVGPEFGPLAGLCVAIVERRRRVARRSLTALAVGFPIGITAAFLFTLICVATGLVDSGFRSVDNPLTQFIAKPDAFSIGVAAALGNWADWRGAIAQLCLNLAGIVAAGTTTLYIQRVLYERRRREHLGETG